VKRWVPLGALGALLACSDPARAADPARAVDPIALAWRAPLGCPDETWAKRALRAYLGSREGDDYKPMSVRIDIAPAPGGRFRAELSLDGGASGDRRFEGATCARVADAAVLIVALMLDPVEVATQIEAPTPREVAAPNPASHEIEGGPGSAARARVRIGIHAAGDAGSLPEPSVGAGLTAGVRFARTRIEADGTAWVPRRALAGATGAIGGEIGLFTAGLRGCVALFGETGGLVIEPCLRLEGGVASGTGFGILEPATSRAPWGAAFAGFAVIQRTAESFGAWLSIEGGTPFVRPDHIIEDFGTVFRANRLLGRLSFGLAWSFP
jgi:hypothetical protein